VFTAVSVGGVMPYKDPEKAREWDRARYPKRGEALRIRGRRHYAKHRHDPEMWIRRAIIRLRGKAKTAGIDFNISAQDLQMPEVCPFTLLPFQFGAHHPQNPSVDRIKPDRGYVRGNVRIISFQANTAKQDIIDPAVFDRLAADARLWGLV
jgi:hypothetical protein